VTEKTAFPLTLLATDINFASQSDVAPYAGRATPAFAAGIYFVLQSYFLCKESGPNQQGVANARRLVPEGDA
jgi:hypothetical protein